VSRLRLIADDLTGALDSGCAFAAPGRPVSVAVPGRPLPTGERLAVSTESRDMDEAGAVAAVTAAVRAFVGAGPDTLWFKKIDSVMRGHPLAETRAAFEAGAFSGCVFAPAYPDMGRITRNGRQYVTDGTGEAVAVGPARLRRHHHRRRPAGNPWHAGGGSQGRDAAEQDLVGRHRRARRRPRKEPVARGLSAGPRPDRRHRPSGDARAGRGRARRRRRHRGPCGRRHALAARPRPDHRDTLSIVLEATGADVLSCIGEAVTGVPVCRVEGGRWHGVTLLSKSGGFGDAGLFSRLIARARRQG
jgi:hypothetical protein